MSQYTQNDLPLDLHHGEVLSLADQTTIRFESNGEAKDVMVNDSFAPTVTLFPGNEYVVRASDGEYRLTCTFEDCMRVEKM